MRGNAPAAAAATGSAAGGADIAKAAMNKGAVCRALFAGLGQVRTCVRVHFLHVRGPAPGKGALLEPHTFVYTKFAIESDN